MALRERLNNLRKQTGTDNTPTSGDDPLRTRLERLHRCSIAHNQAQPRPDDEQLAHQWGGSVLAPGLVLIERRIPLHTRHGQQTLSPLLEPLHALHEARGHAAGRLCFFDTETSGLSGGAGTIAFLLGMGRIEGDTLVVRQYQLSAFAGERAMLAHAGTWLGEEGVLVSYNGKSFDAPLLTSRCRLAGLSSPWGEHNHIDLLHPTRRAFASRWHDCRLVTVEQHLLGFKRHDDLPGAEAPHVWQAFLHTGESTRMARVIEHNYWDILCLAALLPALERVYQAPWRFQADTTAIARHVHKHAGQTVAAAMLAAAGDSLNVEGTLLLVDIYRRQNRWPEALSLLEPLAAQGISGAAERLAKFHEHQRHDYQMALYYANALPKERRHAQRRNRLHAKLSRKNELSCMRGLFDSCT